MAELMVGRQVSFKDDKAPAKPGKNMFRIEKLNVVGNRGVQAVKDLNLSAKAGEILGVAGVDGNGQTELIEAITGLKISIRKNFYQ